MALSTISPSAAFATSDLQKRRREVLDAAHESLVSVRDADGTMLGVAPMRILEGVQAVASIGLDLVNVTSAASRVTDNPASYGALAWLVHLDEEDREECVAELTRELNVAASTLDLADLRRCINEWRATAVALSDSLARSVLLGDVNEQDMVDAGGLEADPG